MAYSPYTLQIVMKKKQLFFVIFLLLLLIITMTLNIQSSHLGYHDNTLIVQNLIERRMQEPEDSNIGLQLIDESVPKDQIDTDKENGFKLQNEDNDKTQKIEKVNYADGEDDDDNEDDDRNEDELQEQSFENFNYPLQTDIRKLIAQTKRKRYVDYKPINVYPYELINSPEEICLGSSIHMIILVKSSVGNFIKRKAIRDTWATIKRVGSRKIKYAFTLGVSANNKALQHLVDMENKRTNDIIQYDFTDAYYNNTLKTIGAINWVTKFCQKANYVMLVDDDYFVAVDTLVLYLQNVLPLEEKEYLFMGHAAGNVRPVRSKHGEYAKWYVPVSEYPYDRYPPFVNAGAMLMTMNFAQDLQIGIQFTKLFRFDDVYLGIVLYKMKARILFQKKFYAAKCDYEDKCFKKALATHGYDEPDELRDAWNRHLENKQSKMRRESM